jgi:hypothetical protein
MPQTGVQTAVLDNNSESICLSAPPRRGAFFFGDTVLSGLSGECSGINQAIAPTSMIGDLRAATIPRQKKRPMVD